MDVTKDNYTTFLQAVLAKVPEDKRAVVEQAFQDDTVAPLLRDAVLARSDYSRQTNQFAQEVAEARANIAQWQDWYQGEVETAAQRQERLDRYQELYGDLEDTTNVNRQPQAKAGIDEKQFQQELAKRDQMAIQFADVLTDLKLDHRDKFGEKLDTSQLMSYAQQHGLNIREAYRQIVEPKEQELADKALDDVIAKAKEEARQEVLTQHRLPVTPPRREPHFLDNTNRVANPRERVSNAVAAFNAGMTGR